MSDTSRDHPAVPRPYEIGLDGNVADLVRRVEPDVRVLAVPTYTILWQYIDATAELEDLLDALIGLGITPHEVHDTGNAPRRRRYCEVRISGLLGDTILRHLGWSHRVAQSTVIILRATQDALRQALTRMSTATGVDYVLALDSAR